jgi:hypothetical protein
LVVTLPTTQQSLELIQSNKYEKYNSSDFVRAHAELFSSIEYNKGLPLVFYWVRLQPDAEAVSKVASLVSSGSLRYSISATTEPIEEPRILTKEAKTFASTEASVIATADLSGRPVTLKNATLDIQLSKYSIARLTVLLFVLR